MEYSLNVNEKGEVFIIDSGEYLGRIDSDGEWRPRGGKIAEEEVKEEISKQYEDSTGNWKQEEWPIEVRRFLGREGVALA